jgi:hypothetical protein
MLSSSLSICDTSTVVINFFVINLNISKIQNLDDQGPSLLGRGDDLREKGIQERDVKLLFYPQRDQKQTKQGENDDEG